MINGALSTSFSIIGKPIGAVRQTKRDVWAKRPSVLRYRAWCDLARKACTGNPTKKLDANQWLGFYAFSHSPMPESWSKKEKAAMAGQLMRQKPDADNVCKAVGDSLFDNDEKLAIMQCVQYWCMQGEEPKVDVFLLPVVNNI